MHQIEKQNKTKTKNNTKKKTKNKTNQTKKTNKQKKKHPHTKNITVHQTMTRNWGFFKVQSLIVAVEVFDTRPKDFEQDSHFQNQTKFWE